MDKIQYIETRQGDKIIIYPKNKLRTIEEIIGNAHNIFEDSKSGVEMFSKLVKKMPIVRALKESDLKIGIKIKG